MNQFNDPSEKHLGTLKIITWAMLVFAPAVYLIIASMVRIDPSPSGTPDNLIIYILLIVGVTSPVMGLVIERIQIQAFKTNQNSKMSPANLFFTVSIIKMAMVEAVYIYGLVVYLLTGSFLNLLYFYPIGIIWSFVHWPRRIKYDQLVERLKQP